MLLHYVSSKHHFYIPNSVTVRCHSVIRVAYEEEEEEEGEGGARAQGVEMAFP